MLQESLYSRTQIPLLLCRRHLGISEDPNELHLPGSTPLCNPPSHTDAGLWPTGHQQMSIQNRDLISTYLQGIMHPTVQRIRTHPLDCSHHHAKKLSLASVRIKDHKETPSYVSRVHFPADQLAECRLMSESRQDKQNNYPPSQFTES